MCMMKTADMRRQRTVPVAVKMLTKVPAEILGVNKGELKAGMDADIVVFDETIAVKQVFLAGQKI